MLGFANQVPILQLRPKAAPEASATDNLSKILGFRSVKKPREFHSFDVDYLLVGTPTV